MMINDKMMKMRNRGISTEWTGENRKEKGRETWFERVSENGG